MQPYCPNDLNSHSHKIESPTLPSKRKFLSIDGSCIQSSAIMRKSMNRKDGVTDASESRGEVKVVCCSSGGEKVGVRNEYSECFVYPEGSSVPLSFL